MSRAAIVSLAFLLCVASPSAVFAGERVEGVGGSRSQAMDDANTRAREESAKRFGGKTGCITPAKLASCREDRGDWICVAYVANHEGSCR